MLLSTSNEKLPVPLLTTANGQGPTLAAGPTLCNLPLRGNIISRKFANCSINVKLVVFKTYCSCLYTAQLWGTCLSRTMNRLKVAYNDSLRMVLGIPRYCSASEMFAYTNVPSCQCVIRLNIYSFMRRIQCTNNIIVRSIVNSDLIFSSLLWRNWRQRLFYIPNS